MSAADDLKTLLDSSGVDLGALPTSFGLADFDYMVTSQRTMAQVHKNLQRAESAGTKHHNLWPDLRVLGLAEDEKLSELGKAALAEFPDLKGEVPRLHYILKNVRSDGGAPSEAREGLEERTRNLEEFIARLPEDGSRRHLLDEPRKLRFLEVLNRFPHVVENFLELRHDRQQALVDLSADELVALYPGPGDGSYRKVARRLANRERHEEATVHFIEAVVQLEYEDIVAKAENGWIPFQVLPKFSRILDESRVEAILARSDDAKVVKVQMHVAEALSEANIVVDEETIVDCFLSLKTRPLLILTGVSGTGKTKLAQLVAKSLSAPSLKIISKEKELSAAASDVASTGNVAFVPVRPDWTDNRQVLGFHNVLNNTFQVTPILELLAAAIREREHAHFVVLDEMNLARVEHYFSDLLSCLESRYPVGDRIEHEPLLLHNAGSSLPSQRKEMTEEEATEGSGYVGPAPTLTSVPARMEVGVNCFFIGTVNVDETTYMFSPKVLDRANVIEVETPSVSTYLSELGAPKGLDTLKKVPLTSEELSSSGSFPFTTVAEARDAVSERAKAESFDFLLELQQLHQILGLWRHEFGPRVMRDFLVYATKSVELSDKSAGLSDEERARLFGLIRIFDACTAQKVLPKIHGSKRVIEELLQTLLGFCAEGYDTGAHAGVLNTRSSPRGRELARKDFAAGDFRFPRSARKVHEMLRQLDAMNYASFIR